MQHKKHGQNMKAKHLLRRTGHSMSMPAESMPAPAEVLMKKTGGAVEGRASGGRLDKLARGGRKAPNVTVNVINAKPPGGDMPMPPPMMAPPPGPMLPPGALPPPPMAGGPGPALPPPGGPIGGMKTGGRMQKKSSGGEPTQGYSTKKIPAPSEEKHLKAGGRAAPKMTGGAGSGIGREEKADLVKEKPKAK